MWQQNRRHRRKHAQLDLGLSKPRPRAGDDYVAGGHQFTAAAQRRPINYGNRRPRDQLEVAKDSVERIEHLRNRFFHVLFRRDARAKRATAGVGVKYNRRQLTLLRTLIERVVDLAHHRDVKDIQRRAAERDPRDAIVDLELDVLEFLSHCALS